MSNIQTTTTTINLADDERQKLIRIYQTPVFSIVDEVATNISKIVAQIFSGEILPALKMEVARVYKQKDKQQYCAAVINALVRADLQNRIVMLDKNKNKKNHDLRMRVIAALVKTDYCKEIPSKPGSPSKTRLVPTAKIRKLGLGPDDIAPNYLRQFVFMRDDKKQEIDFDWTKKAIEYQDKLDAINYVNSCWGISYKAYDVVEQQFNDNQLRLRPVQKAVFKNDFDTCGKP